MLVLDSFENRYHSLHFYLDPTLLVSGRYDEVTPACVETVPQGIAGSEWVLFEQSSHRSHLEETERFMQVLNEFLSRVEGSAES
jgi:pimeloyl-ACP methyl ester carboxylesterase